MRMVTIIRTGLNVNEKILYFLPEKQITVMEIHARTTDPASSPLTTFSVVAFWDSAEENVKVTKRDVKIFWSRKA